MIPPVPSPGEVRAARLHAGHTLAQAAAAMGYTSHSRVAELESGARRINAVRWGWYLLATGQHPTLKLAPRRRRHDDPR